jgi:polyribonucleotide nucleotidyltransferase
MNKIIKKETEFAGKKLILETGELAYLTNLAVKATYGDTVVLVTVVAGPANPDLDFFPLTVNYEEKLYASGMIKSSRFFKRDGRPTDDAIITKRLIDHAIRPLFPSGYMDEVEVVVTVLSLDEETDPEVLAMLATSAVLHASDIPWTGPMTAAKVGLIDGKYVLNPTRKQLTEESELDMIVSFVGKDRKFLAVEAEAHILPEEKILGAMEFARDNLEELPDFIEDFAKEVNPNFEKYEYESKSATEELMKDVSEAVGDRIEKLIRMEFDKIKTKKAEKEIKEDLLEKFEEKYSKSELMTAFEEMEKKAIQKLILKEEKRPDGRGLKDVRDITSKVGILPRTHGSGLFTRGITQMLTVATLGSPSSELLIQNMYGEESKRFIHYYHFPPFSGGETGRMGYAKPREIGHGMLAEKALKPVIPTEDDFPYMILLVSETLSSSGSTSMAATCGSTLALMDAGVPIKDMVAGVGVGLIINDDFSEYKLLTDLAYKEDAFGFLDYKMTGTKDGVTAIQSDMKVQGIPMDLLPEILKQSKEARMHVLGEMEKTIKEPRSTVSDRAPKMSVINIDPDKIGMVIGSGGKTIKELQERTETEIFIEETGKIVATGMTKEAADAAVERISGMLKEVEAGEEYEGEVVELLDFGALVEILPGKVGLLHISEIANAYVESVEEFFKVGDKVKVKVLEAGRDGKISLSKKALEPGYEENSRGGGRGDRGNRGFKNNRGGRGDRGGRNNRDNRGPRGRR